VFKGNVKVVVDVDNVADDIGLSGEAAGPEFVSDDRNAWSGGRFVSGREVAT
jgi:hypothetical protein